MSNFVPDSDHISRFCRKGEVSEDGRITGQAFKLRPRDMLDKNGLSVNWLESLELGNRGEEINKVRMIHEEKGLPINDKTRIAVLNVGETRKYVRKESPDNREIQVERKETLSDPSHSRIIGDLKQDDAIIFELLANTVKEDYPSQEQETSPNPDSSNPPK